MTVQYQVFPARMLSGREWAPPRHPHANLGRLCGSPRGAFFQGDLDLDEAQRGLERNHQSRHIQGAEHGASTDDQHRRCQIRWVAGLGQQYRDAASDDVAELADTALGESIELRKLLAHTV